MENVIVTVEKGQNVYLTGDYILGDLEGALVLDYPIIDEQYCMIVGDSKSTCKELIKSRAEKDLPRFEAQLKEINAAVSKLREILKVNEEI